MMSLALLALSLNILPGVVPKDDAVKRELEKFRGTWQLVSTEAGGVTFHRKTDVLMIEGDKLAYASAGEKPEARQRFKIDPSSDPKTIDVDDVVIRATGKETPIAVLGIYAVEGDTLKLFLNRAGKRPRSFTATEKGKGVMCVYRRQPEGGAERKKTVTTGVVKEIDNQTLLLKGGERFGLDAATHYAIETGRDPKEARHADIKAGLRVTISWRNEGKGRVAEMVLVDRLQPDEAGRAHVEDLLKK
jgi:uncharacterized protein (TIGR03067 family)